MQSCTDKEWNNCRVEKMGCPGCHYDDPTDPNRIVDPRDLKCKKIRGSGKN